MLCFDNWVNVKYNTYMNLIAQMQNYFLLILPLFFL